MAVEVACVFADLGRRLSAITRSDFESLLRDHRGTY
jgi:hypothetical protein